MEFLLSRISKHEIHIMLGLVLLFIVCLLTAHIQYTIILDTNILSMNYEYRYIYIVIRDVRDCLVWRFLN